MSWKPTYCPIIVPNKMVLVWLCFLVVSCGTHVDKEEVILDQRQILNINFNENVQSTNPFLAKSESEVFIRNLQFVPFYNKNETSSIIKSIRFDAISQAYIFSLFPNITFQDGSSVNNSHIKQAFQRLLTAYNDDTLVSSFFHSIAGMPKINWLMQNRNIRDSLPSGFRFEQKNKFSIESSLNHTQMLQALSHPSLHIAKEKKGKWFGTGDFKVTYENEDILYTLTRKVPTTDGINQVNLRFIKNKEVQIEEFLKGQLDLIRYEYQAEGGSNSQLINEYINNKYPPIQITLSEKSRLRYALISNIADSNQLLLMINKLTNKDFPWYASNQGENIVLFSKREDNHLDTTLNLVNPPVIDNINSYYDQLKNTTDTINLFKKMSLDEMAHPQSPKFVIEEIPASLIKENAPRETIDLLSQNINFVQADSSTVLIILNYHKSYYLSKYSLAGIKHFLSLEENINQLKFVVPKTY